jgi:hypothetical protein
MAEAARNDEFFVGYQAAPPPGLRPFLLAVMAIVLAVFALASLAIAVGTQSPGKGEFGPGGSQSLTGLLETKPYPVLRLPADKDHPQPRTIPLAGEGKNGVAVVAAPLAGKRVEARGILVRRGSFDMLLTSVGAMHAVSAEAPLVPAAAVPLGRWRITGEICDGKCSAGAMHPGTSIAHRACANLCITGGVPAVFVSTAPVEGATFFLLADKNGGPAPDAIYDYVGLRIEIEGELKRLDDLLVFEIDPATAKVK